MLSKDSNFSFPATGPARSGINPNTNFLLKKAELLASIEDECGNCLSLYKLHNKNFAVHTKYSNPLRADTLERVDLHAVAEKFRLKVVVV